MESLTFFRIDLHSMLVLKDVFHDDNFTFNIIQYPPTILLKNLTCEGGIKGVQHDLYRHIFVIINIKIAWHKTLGISN